MVVAHVLSHQPLEMPLVEHDHMIEQVSPAIADETLRDAILSRTAKAGPLGLDAEALDGAKDLGIEVGGAVENEILRSRVIGKCVPQLLCHPGARRMPGHITVEYAPSVGFRPIPYSHRDRGHVSDTVPALE